MYPALVSNILQILKKTYYAENYQWVQFRFFLSGLTSDVCNITSLGFLYDLWLVSAVVQ